MEHRNFYEVLGISEEADIAEIRKAYRDLAMKYHPDRNPGDAEAEERFKEIRQAYDTLVDPERRKWYDEWLKERDSANAGSRQKEAGRTAAPAAGIQADDKTYILVMYALYALGFVSIFTTVVGVILAYVKRGDMGDTLYGNHADYLIKTFWGALAGYIISWITVFIGIGVVLMFIVSVWFVYRLVVGFVKLTDGKRVPLDTWF